MAPPAETGARRRDLRAPRAAAMPASPARTRPEPGEETARPAPAIVAAPPRPWLPALAARAARLLRRIDAWTSMRAHDRDGRW
jgi:hypothetical protein